MIIFLLLKFNDSLKTKIQKIIILNYLTGFLLFLIWVDKKVMKNSPS